MSKSEYQPNLFQTKQMAALGSALFEAIPTVSGFASNLHGDFVSFRITYRGPGDYLAVAKRYGDDGGLQVLFGSGSTFLDCLSGLESAMDQDKWRPDKYAVRGLKS